VGGVTTFGVVLSVWLTAGWGGEAVVNTACNYGSLAMAVFASFSAGWAARRSGRGRRRIAWALLAIAVGGWAVGSALWIYYEAVHVAPFPSPADAAYLLFPVAACLGLAMYPIGYSGHSRMRLAIDGFIIAAALFQVSWVAILQGMYEAGRSGRFAMGLSLAYPVGDLVVIMVALLVLARARTGQRRTLALLTLGVILMAVSDSAFVYLNAHNGYRAGSVADVGWIVGLMVIGIAALLAQRTREPDVSQLRPPSRIAMTLPFWPTAVAIAVCAPICLRTPGMGALFLSSVLLVGALMARQHFVVGENRTLLEIVADQSMRDPLTGLANRALFNDRLAHAMLLRQRDGRTVAVLSIDVDDFKLVNDNLGHHAGDELLALIAGRLLGCARSGDTVARLGGDEFAILVEGNADYSRRVANRIVQAFDELFLIEGHDLLVRVSVGYATAATGSEINDVDADELLKRADVAMYAAKRSRTGGVHAFNPEMHLSDGDERARAVTADGHSGAVTFRLLGQLRQAIEHGDLTLRYQPKIWLHDDMVAGVEALIRWPHPERGLLGPDEFLPLVREHGLMRAVTDLVVVKALDDMVCWREQGADVAVAVNVFAPSMCELSLPGRLLRELNVRGLPPNVLTVEITEDLLLDNMDRTRGVIERLRGYGIRVAIDDFGSGYSSLGYLCDLPIDEVKLDRRFIAPILVDERAAAVVRAVVDLAADLDMITVAEGVENAATAARLREYGCQVAQGFHFSRPLPAADIAALMPRATTTQGPASARSS
jgi:diguanylate cyclase